MGGLVSAGLKDIVLVGAGHSHVQLLRQHGMRPFRARLTLIVDDPVSVYSGMVPGLVAGQYAQHELEIDARPLARRAGVRVLTARANRIDPDTGTVHMKGRPAVRYDLCSLNIGATVAGLDVPGVREFALATRPIAHLVAEIDVRVADLGATPRIVVVGAGAGGVELAFCIEQRLRAGGARPHITLVYPSERPLPGRHPRVGNSVVQAAHARGLVLRPGRRVVEVRADAVELDDGEAIPSDLTLWVAGATAHPLPRDSGLPVDDGGFVQVADTLEVEGTEGLFAAGDCAVLASWPEVPKAGVYAVRQGPVLADNLRAALSGRALTPYQAQRDFFGILNLGDGTAIGTKWGVPVTGPLVMRWKDRIDRKFMEKFQVLDAAQQPAPAFVRGMPPMPEMEMVCGGCAAKVGQTPLTRALNRLPPSKPDPRVVLGTAEADDVVAWRHGPGLVVQNVDAFTAFTDDPFLVGRIAAHNATSDLFAKGVDPAFAMAFVQIPEEGPIEETLFQVMSGLRDALDGDGVSLLGGHTLVGAKLTVGLAVTGHTETALWSLDGARPGDMLVLTRALGTGVLFHADMAGQAPGRAVHAALNAMSEGNGPASRALRGHDIHAATDVTGFGLGRHLAEILNASGCSAVLDLDALPVYPSVANLLAAGVRSTFHEENRTLLKALHIPTSAASHPALELLFDPQTAGGLLVAVSPGTPVEGAVIGTVTARRSDGAIFTVNA